MQLREVHLQRPAWEHEVRTWRQGQRLFLRNLANMNIGARSTVRRMKGPRLLGMETTPKPVSRQPSLQPSKLPKTLMDKLWS